MKKKTFFLVSQVLSVRLKKQTSRNVTDTTFEIFNVKKLVKTKKVVYNFLASSRKDVNP